MKKIIFVAAVLALASSAFASQKETLCGSLNGLCGNGSGSCSVSISVTGESGERSLILNSRAKAMADKIITARDDGQGGGLAQVTGTQEPDGFVVTSLSAVAACPRQF